MNNYMKVLIKDETLAKLCDKYNLNINVNKDENEICGHYYKSGLFTEFPHHHDDITEWFIRFITEDKDSFYPPVSAQVITNIKNHSSEINGSLEYYFIEKAYVTGEADIESKYYGEEYYKQKHKKTHYYVTDQDWTCHKHKSSLLKEIENGTDKVCKFAIKIGNVHTENTL